MGIIIGYIKGVPDERSALFQRGEMSESNGLQQHIANRGRFDGTCDDLATGHIRGELIQQAIARASTDDVDHRQIFTGKLTKFFCAPAVFERQALENTTHDFRVRLRDGLARFLTKALNALDHIPGSEKAIVSDCNK